MTRVVAAIAPAWQDPWRGLEHLLAAERERGLIKIFGGLFLGWWLYVPIHELFHAWACLLGGGTVERLEIDAFYGGHLWAAVFPWVVAASDYAGRLSGFSTHGNDLVYFATCFAPFLLTLFPGVFWLRRSVARGSALGFGLALVPALAPFLSLTGDFFEMGGLILTQLPAFEAQTSTLISDDLFRWIDEVGRQDDPPWLAGVLMGTIGLLLVFQTTILADMISRRLGRPPVASYCEL